MPAREPSKTDKDLNQIAKETVAKAIDRTASASMPADLEAAWKAWSGSIQKVDARTMTLLRAAFDAGAEAAGKRSR